MNLKLVSAFLAGLGLVFSLAPAAAEQRVALVIGNGTYKTLAKTRLSELERQDVAAIDAPAQRALSEAEPKDEPATTRNVDVVCKKFFRSVGMMLTVPCGVDAPDSSSAAKTSGPESTSTPPVHDCDRLAAAPSDPVRMSDGVKFDQIQGEEAVRACQRALEAYPGSARFEFQLGRAFHRKKSYGEALTHYRSAVDKTYTSAMNNLGGMYEDGQGVAKDEAEAVRWYRKAAENGEASAMYNLGRMYEDGQGVAKDRRAAARHVFDALRLGNAFTVKEMTTNTNAWSKEFRRGLQRLMRDAGVYSGPIDGSFGPGTRRAIEALPGLKDSPT